MSKHKAAPGGGLVSERQSMFPQGVWCDVGSGGRGNCGRWVKKTRFLKVILREGPELRRGP